jgi:hypothetical protein
MLSWDTKEILLNEVAEQEITDLTTYNALVTKRKAIIYGTSASPTTTGWVEGNIYCVYTP